MNDELFGGPAQIVTIHPDYYYGGKKRSMPPLPSREEELKKAEKDFIKAIKEENDEILTMQDEGIAIIQQGRYPYTLDCFFQPTPAVKRLERNTVDIPTRVVVGAVFTSASYWLSKGKLKKIVDDKSVLNLEKLSLGIKFLEKKLKSPLNFEGNKFVFFQATDPHPCRVFKGRDFWLVISLHSGVIFKLDKLPKTEALGERFQYRGIFFRTEYKRLVRI